SYSSASPALSNKVIYKRFFRVFPPESSFNAAKFEFLNHFKWKKVGTLHETKEPFALTTTDFVNKASQHGIQILASESFANDPRQQVRNLKKHGVRIIVGNFYEDKARIIFCEAYKEKMYGSKYVWIITGFYSREWWKGNADDDPHDCTTDQLEEAINGYFTGDAMPKSPENTRGISGKTYEEFIAEYNNFTANASLTGHQEAPYGYDSVWTVAYMLNRSLEFMTKSKWGKRLEDFEYRDKRMGDVFFRMMANTFFEGVSGPVLFDSNGDRRGLTQIEQLQNGLETTVAIYNPRQQGKQTIRWYNKINWIGDTPPSDSMKQKMVPRVISFALLLCMSACACLGIILTIGFIIFNVKYRDHRFIKMSSPNLNNVILAGALLAFGSIIFGGIDIGLVEEHDVLLMCKIHIWLLALGFSLAFGAMFSKTWRVHKIFTNKKMHRTLDPDDDNQMLIPQTLFCESEHMWYFSGVLCAVKGILLMFGAFLAYETRKVRVPALNDSKFIGISVYNVVVLCMIGVPIVLIMKDKVDVTYALISTFTFFATATTLCLVFIPKILNRNHEMHTGTILTKAIQKHHIKRTTMRSLMKGALDDADRKQMIKMKEELSNHKKQIQVQQRRIRDLEKEKGLDNNSLHPNHVAHISSKSNRVSECQQRLLDSHVTVNDACSNEKQSTHSAASDIPEVPHVNTCTGITHLSVNTPDDDIEYKSNENSINVR
ncbi:unnamed protein product, partial [Owenia fusiformis]